MTQLPDHTRDAIDAVRRAVERERDFGGWLANILRTVATDHWNGSAALLEGRPGSWEAQHVEALHDGGTDLLWEERAQAGQA